MNKSDDRMNLEALDPASTDPGFWVRFHGRVMDRAKNELTRRRMAGEWSVAEVVFQWRKPLIPLTLLAASLAGVFVMSHEEPGPVSAPTPIALEEALVQDLPGDPIPIVLATTGELDEADFLTAAGGFLP
jgi:hypothetical protein